MQRPPGHGAREGASPGTRRRWRDAARDGRRRRRSGSAYFPFSDLKKDANVLIFPDLQSGNLALHLLQHMGEAVLVGPVLMGTAHPVHLLQYGSSVESIVNLTTMGIVQAAAKR